MAAGTARRPNRSGSDPRRAGSSLGPRDRGGLRIPLHGAAHHSPSGPRARPGGGREPSASAPRLPARSSW
ncbi:hypothetical protein FM106_25730 [Brachybacterium faecium]|nr:hypothetical protein FM106_25730 [Brachybacterium faecium]